MHTSVALLLELGLILTALSALGALARRFALTPVPLYLLAGLALGEGGIAPVPAAGEFVEIGGAIGVVLLLLTLGLEFSVGELAISMRRHLPSAAVDLVLNATPGAIAGWLIGLNPVGIMALAGATWISSSGIVARLLDDLGRLGNRETPAVLSVLVLEDFAMAAYLPVLTVLAVGGTGWQAALGMFIAVAAVAGAFAVTQRWGPLIGRLLSHPEPEQLLLRVLGTTLVVAGLAELVGASAAGRGVPRRAHPHRPTRYPSPRRPDPVARPVRRRVLPCHRIGRRARCPATGAPRRARARRRHRRHQAAHRRLRGLPGQGGTPRATPRRRRVDPARGIFHRHPRAPPSPTPLWLP
jgi:hypothetical protein